jgi:phosphatidylserine decarboxylase
MACPVKGSALEPEALLGTKDRVTPFIEGPVILARLSPVDYHHLHFPDDGYIRDEARIGHRLWTVNPPALRNQPDILFRNERHIQILELDHFGRVAFVEIGALSVGRIVSIRASGSGAARKKRLQVWRLGSRAVWRKGRVVAGVRRDCQHPQGDRDVYPARRDDRDGRPDSTAGDAT